MGDDLFVLPESRRYRRRSLMLTRWDTSDWRRAISAQRATASCTPAPPPVSTTAAPRDPACVRWEGGGG